MSTSHDPGALLQVAIAYAPTINALVRAVVAALSVRKTDARAAPRATRRRPPRRPRLRHTRAPTTAGTSGSHFRRHETLAPSRGGMVGEGQCAFLRG